jgi:hypothetical protein
VFRVTTNLSVTSLVRYFAGIILLFRLSSEYITKDYLAGYLPLFIFGSMCVLLATEFSSHSPSSSWSVLDWVAVLFVSMVILATTVPGNLLVTLASERMTGTVQRILQPLSFLALFITIGQGLLTQSLSPIVIGLALVVLPKWWFSRRNNTI